MASSQTSTSEIPTMSVENATLDVVTEEDLYPLPLRSVKSVPGKFCSEHIIFASTVTPPIDLLTQVLYFASRVY